MLKWILFIDKNINSLYNNFVLFTNYQQLARNYMSFIIILVTCKQIFIGYDTDNRTTQWF